MQPGSFAPPVVTYRGLVKYFRDTDLVSLATREVELAIWRRNQVADYAPPDGMGVGVEKVCVVGSYPMSIVCGSLRAGLLVTELAEAPGGPAMTGPPYRFLRIFLRVFSLLAALGGC